MIEMKLRKVYFKKVASGEKIFEVRLNDEKRKQLKVGDLITFKNEQNLNEQVTARVEDLLYFDSFKSMAQALPPKQIGMENYSVSQIENTYHQFYSAEDEKKFGVVAIKVEVKK